MHAAQIDQSALHPMPDEWQRSDHANNSAGRDRTRAPNPRPAPRTRLAHPAKVLATLSHLHHHAPATALAPLFDASPTTLTTAIRTTRQLLTQAGITITPNPHPARTTTELLTLTTTAGITLPTSPASTNPPDTPTESNFLPLAVGP